MTSGSRGIVGVGGDLPLEGFLVGALEVAQALRPGLADAGVLVFLLDDVGPALGLDPGQGQLFAQDLGQLVHGQLDFEDVLPGCVAGPGAGLAVARAADRRADVARALADAAPVLGPVAELGDLDLRQGDRNELAPGLADHLAVRDVLTQVGLDLAPDDLLEPIGVTINFSNHGCLVLASGCWGRVRPIAPISNHVAARKRSTFALRPQRSTEPKNKRSSGDNLPGSDG